MKYTPSQYAKSLLSALKNKPEHEQKKIMVHFLRVLRKNRDWNNRGKIFRETEKQFFKESGIQKICVETPSPIFREIKRGIEKIFGKKMFFRAQIKKDLLAGIRITIDDEIRIDATAKNRLKNFFSSAHRNG